MNINRKINLNSNLNKNSKNIINLLMLSVLSFSTAVFADTVTIPVNQQSNKSIETPQRGKTMDQVESEFGEPLEKFAAVGEPPITKWRYAEFTVYFETNIVLHSVINHSN